MTQTATNIEQSKRLLSLGIDPETADMMHCKLFEEYRLYPVNWKHGRITDRNVSEDLIPAWSLSALIGNVIPKEIMLLPSDRISTGLKIRYGDNAYEMFYSAIPVKAESPDLFAACIDLIEQLVEQGYIKIKKV